MLHHHPHQPCDCVRLVLQPSGGEQCSSHSFLTKRLPYCWGKLIPHTYCEHMSVAKVSCGNVKVNATYGLLAALLIGGFDMFCISVSYTMILRTVVSLSSVEARHKAFGTCTSHLCAIVITCSSLIHHFYSPIWGTKYSPSYSHHYCQSLSIVSYHSEPHCLWSQDQADPRRSHQTIL
jgi:hypothetical protein